MGDLSCFLAQNAIKVENVRFVVSKRFLDKDKRPIEWEICCITPAEDEALKKECTKRVPVVGKKGAFLPETDYNAYVGKLAAKCTVFPNLSNKELQDSYCVMGEDALLKAMLTPGEYSDYLAKVQEVNGFDIAMDELVEDAKN
ncbi:phage tail assembly chaperone [Enterocloster bolteae]|uniref:phage tail assembly chaperone n=1 Tax=Enterocloster bolteae TaxID=208479 RepID=UPI002A7FF431|nr:phage portal protein [Enterocloster bolteae]